MLYTFVQYGGEGTANSPPKVPFLQKTRGKKFWWRIIAVLMNK